MCSRLFFFIQISPRTNDSSKKIIMVDPLEAKRLANKQMQEIQAKEKFKVEEIHYLMKIMNNK